MDALTGEQRDALHRALVDLERELSSAHASTAEGAAPVDLDEPIGRVSRIDAIAQQRMVQASRATQKRRLQHVRAALRRVDEDDYGVCATCGEEIGFPRLQAQPEAPFCIACQSERERVR